MDTITIQNQGQAFEVPILVAFESKTGKPVFDLAGDVEPEHCDHKGACWSDCLGLRCPRCGAQLFLPPRFLANRPADEIEEMHALWRAAGGPPWYGTEWGTMPNYWTIVPVRQFAELGGLPILTDRLASIREDVCFALLEKRAVRP